MLVGRLTSKTVGVSVISRNPLQVEGARSYECSLIDRIQVADVIDRIHEDQGDVTGIVFAQRYRGPQDQNWDGELATTLGGVETILDCVGPRLGAGNLRSVVLVSSVNATRVSPALPLSYHVAKAGLIQMARYYAWKLGPLGVRVNVVAPGTFVKPESEAYYMAAVGAREQIIKTSALKRMGTADDVVNVIEFLLGDSSGFVTGQTITVDGGASLKWSEVDEDPGLW